MSEDPCRVVSEGRYELVYVRHTYIWIYSGHRCCVTFRIVTHGDAFDVLVPRYYRVEKRNKGYRSGRNSNLTRDAVRLFGKAAAKDGMPWDKLKKAVVWGEVRTVTTDQKGYDLGKDNYYSKVDHLIRVIP